MRSTFTLLVLSVLGAGCLSEQLDDAPSGSFACTTVDDCLDDEICLLGRCENVDPPSLEVRDPEQFEIVADIRTGVPAAMELRVTIGGTGLTLVEPLNSGEGNAGEGYVEVSLDGTKVADVSSGSLAAGVSVLGSLSPTPGPHRISLLARRADGTAYDNPGASAVQLVWVDDGRPQVGIVSPLPQTAFDLGETEIDVRLATLNFALVPSAATADEPHGHAHVHYDDPFPVCTDLPECDCCYVAVASPGTADVPAQGFLREWTEPVVLPSSSAGGAELTAVLRRTNHSPFRDENGNTIFDTIQLQRISDPDATAEAVEEVAP